jgi:ribosome maturation protein SDO1
MNVSKGEIASKEDLVKAFKHDDVEKIILEVYTIYIWIYTKILKKGDIQITEKERSIQLEQVTKDIASIISSKCINPDTKRPYTSSMVEKAMSDLHVSINTSKSAKQQVPISKLI